MRQFNEFLRAGGLEVLAHEQAEERDEFDRELARRAAEYRRQGHPRQDPVERARGDLVGRHRTEAEAREQFNAYAKAKAEAAGQSGVDARKVEDGLTAIYRSRGMSAEAARYAAEGRPVVDGPDLRGGRW